MEINTDSVFRIRWNREDWIHVHFVTSSDCYSMQTTIQMNPVTDFKMNEIVFFSLVTFSKRENSIFRSPLFQFMFEQTDKLQTCSFPNKKELKTTHCQYINIFTLSFSSNVQCSFVFSLSFEWQNWMHNFQMSKCKTFVCISVHCVWCLNKNEKTGEKNKKVGASKCEIKIDR